ncbi:MAG: helix-turn-helix domain-containing protein [bacterium]|nr:helix-turn-helix domain-containing protein [bacterium]
MHLNRVIQSLGFTEKEANVYLSLLELGNCTLSSISRKVRLPKEETYLILKKLVDNDYLWSLDSGKSLQFGALSPQKLIELFENKLEKARMVLPELSALDNLNQVKPRISYYEGRKGMINIMEDSLSAQGDILCWADISIAHETLADYYPEYIRKKNVRNIFVRGIFTDDPKSQEFMKKGELEKREVRIIPREKFPFKNEINIYNDSVSIIAHRELVGVIIQSKDIAETQRSIFKLGWEYAGLLAKLQAAKTDNEYLTILKNMKSLQ